MAVCANLVANWITKYKWIAWIGLLAILIVAIDLIYTDLSLFLNV
jgi:predicted tellurium resistance membrane protein TerC